MDFLVDFLGANSLVQWAPIPKAGHSGAIGLSRRPLFSQYRVQPYGENRGGMTPY
jgi:hypothetical protein